MGKKLSVLLGLRDKTEKSMQNMLDDMFQKFKNKQGLFKGTRKTYSAIDGYADDPTKRGYVQVASTVAEQLEWFKKNTKDYFGITFSIEKTNAAGVTAELVVDNTSWGTYTTLELLRLKSIMDGKMRSMLAELPVRPETVIWDKTTDENYSGREIFESPLDKGFSKTTLKETYILTDPHADKPGRQPQVAEKSTQVNVGSYTTQDFSGELTMLQRAQMMLKYDKLYTAIVEALETANNAESQDSDLGDKVLDFLF